MFEFLRRSGWTNRRLAAFGVVAAVVGAGAVAIGLWLPEPYRQPSFDSVEVGDPVAPGMLDLAFAAGGTARIVRSDLHRVVGLREPPAAFVDDLDGGLIIKFQEVVEWHRRDGSVNPIELPDGMSWDRVPFLQVAFVRGRRVLVATPLELFARKSRYALMLYELDTGGWRRIVEYPHRITARANADRFAVVTSPKLGCHGVEVLDAHGTVLHRFRNDLAEGRTTCRGFLSSRDAWLSESGDELFVWTVVRQHGAHDDGPAFITRVDLRTGVQRSWGDEYAVHIGWRAVPISDDRFIASSSLVELVDDGAVLHPIQYDIAPHSPFGETWAPTMQIGVAPDPLCDLRCALGL